MEPAPRCPVCGEHRWEVVRDYCYRASDHAHGEGFTDYERMRRRVLFEVWFPGQDVVTLRCQLCRGCGFVTFVPRPTGEDLGAMGRFLSAVAPAGTPGSGFSLAGQHSPQQAADERRRAQRVLETVDRHVEVRDARVLDFGGGDGLLLGPFLERGARCSLIDYHPQPRPGVVKLGESLDAVPAGARFDVVVCSHVLEHLAEPAALVQTLGGLLTERGVLYGEVPGEVWRGIPIDREPATHLNFFTRGSFEELFVRCGLSVAESYETSGVVGTIRMDVIVVVARRGHAGAPAGTGDVVADAERRLHPTAPMELARAWRLRRFPTPSRVWRHLVKRSG